MGNTNPVCERKESGQDSIQNLKAIFNSIKLSANSDDLRDTILHTLNEMLYADPECMTQLINTYFPCKANVGEVKDSIISRRETSTMLGPISLINTALNTLGIGRIAAKGTLNTDKTGLLFIEGFRKYPEDFEKPQKVVGVTAPAVEESLCQLDSKETPCAN